MQENEHPEVRLAEETLVYLRGQMKEAVAEAVREVMTPEAAREFWLVGIRAMRDEATLQTGRMVLEGAAAWIKRAFWIGLGLLVVWQLGGWSLVAATWKAIVKGAA